MTAPNWVRRPEATRTLAADSNLGRGGRADGKQEIAAMRLSSVRRRKDAVAVEVLQLGQLSGESKLVCAPWSVTDESYNFHPDEVVFWSVETYPTDVFKLNPRCSGSHTASCG